jgi:hypothetical protein
MPPESLEQPANNPAQQLINDIARMQAQQREQLNHLMNLQRAVFMQPQVH